MVFLSTGFDLCHCVERTRDCARELVDFVFAKAVYFDTSQRYLTPEGGTGTLTL